MMKRRLTDDEEHEITGRYKAGEDANQLAAAYGVSSDSIGNAIKRNGGKMRSLKEVKRKFTDELEQEIVRRYKAGENTVQLGAAYGVSHSTIQRIIKRNGQKMRSIKESQGGFTDEQEQEIVRRYNAGESTLQLAAAYNACNPTIGNIVRRNGHQSRSHRELNGSLPIEQEQEITRRYMAGDNTFELAAAYGVTDSSIGRIIRRNGGKMRSLTEARTGLTSAQELEIARRYAAGENSVQLAPAYGVSIPCIISIVRRSGGEMRPSGFYGDSVQDAIDCTSHHANARDCSFYIFSLANHPDYAKAGIAFDVETRLRQGQGEYGTEQLRITYATRQEAYLLEKAVLDATRGNAHCPDALIDWPGASELRAIPADDLVDIAERLADEMDHLGLWELAARYVPMTSAQRAVCQQRAMEHVQACAPGDALVARMPISWAAGLLSEEEPLTEKLHHESAGLGANPMDG